MRTPEYKKPAFPSNLLPKITAGLSKSDFSESFRNPFVPEDEVTLLRVKEIKPELLVMIMGISVFKPERCEASR